MRSGSPGRVHERAEPAGPRVLRRRVTGVDTFWIDARAREVNTKPRVQAGTPSTPGGLPAARVAKFWNEARSLCDGTTPTWDDGRDRLHRTGPAGRAHQRRGKPAIFAAGQANFPVNGGVRGCWHEAAAYARVRRQARCHHRLPLVPRRAALTVGVIASSCAATSTATRARPRSAVVSGVGPLRHSTTRPATCALSGAPRHHLGRRRAPHPLGGAGTIRSYARVQGRGRLCAAAVSIARPPTAIRPRRRLYRDRGHDAVLLP